MKTLFKNSKVLNVFLEEIVTTNVLVEDDKIIGLGDYYNTADTIIDLNGKYVVPGFIDGHMHIESTMMIPYEFSKSVIPHGTVGVAADPHEIANVCGTDGIKFMLEASKGLPIDTYIMLPSCVPSTMFDESGAVLNASDLYPLYNLDRVLGLAEMMNYPGVIYKDKTVIDKLNDAKKLNKIIDGHAPLLTGESLDKYISEGITSDHEHSTLTEAIECISKGEWIMIREGTAAKNLESLIGLFKAPYSSRCLLATDDRHPRDIDKEGHIDNIVRKAISLGASPITAYKMASFNACQYFKLPYKGAIAPGYKADFLIIDDLERVNILDVYKDGKKVVDNKKLIEYKKPNISKELLDKALNSFNLSPLKESDFYITPKGKRVRVIETIKHELLTNEVIMELDFNTNNGIDIKNDILKLAVVERHKNTGHIGLGYIKGIGLKSGAIASSVSHDNHNLIVLGTNDSDMAFASNVIREMGGGLCAVKDGKVIEKLALPYGGLMSDKDSKILAEENERLNEAIISLGCSRDSTPLMTTAFVSLTVIPSLKMSTLGLIDVNKFKPVDLFLD